MLHVVDSLAGPVSELWKSLQYEYTKKGSFFVASPLSGTPLPIYRHVLENASAFANWDQFRFVLMDELIESEDASPSYVPVSNPGSYEGFARNNFITPLSQTVRLNEPIILKPNLDKLESFNHPIHLLILAIGVGGNYANVMPGTPIGTGWHIAHLTDQFRSAHSGSSGAYAGAEFTKSGMSLGPQQVLAAGNIVVIASGSKKRDLVQRLLAHREFEPDFPISIIHHPLVRDKVSIYVTNDAMA